MTIINTNARARRLVTVSSASPMSPQVAPVSQVMAPQTNQTTVNALPSVTSTSNQTPISLGGGVSTNLITILGNLNSFISMTSEGNTAADLQELLQGSSGDLLTQAMTELTASKGDGTTLIITTQPPPVEEENWSQVCAEMNEV